MNGRGETNLVLWETIPWARRCKALCILLIKIERKFDVKLDNLSKS